MASLGNMYPNLPGMLVEFKDGGQALKFDQTEVNTDSMLILGTAVDGPVMEPIAVDENTAELLFGSELKANGAPNGSTLIRAFKEALDSGCQDIRLMRVTGSQAEATIKAPSEEIETVTRKDENLGLTAGNDETNLTLTGKGIKKDSVKVDAKGKRIDPKLISIVQVADVTTVTIAENACDAGSMLSVQYNFERVDNVTESNILLGAERQLVLNAVPIDGSIVVKTPSGAIVDSAHVSFEGNVVKLTTDGATALKGIKLNSESEVLYVTDDVKSKNKTKTTIRAIGDFYTVEYKTLVKGTHVEVADASGSQFKAATGEQRVILSSTPRSESEISLYVDNTLVLDNKSYRVDLSQNAIYLKREYFAKAATISASYFESKTEIVKKEIKVKSLFGGELYNEAKVEVISVLSSEGAAVTKAIRLTKPSSKLSSGEEPMVFSAHKLETFGQIVEAINTHSGIFYAETDVPNELTSNLEYAETYFRHGDDGVDISKEELFVALSGQRDANGLLEKQGAYQLLENYQVDWVVPVGVYADDQLLDRNKDFAYELALFCAVSSFRNKATYGAISMKPLQDTSLASVQAHAKYLANFKNQYFMKNNNGSIIVDGQGNPIDLGKFISLVAGPTITLNHKVTSLKDGNGAVAYVSYTTTLLPQSSPTNKRITGSLGVKYNFSNAQLNDIAGNRMVCFGKKFSARGDVLQGAYIIDGPTCARPGSEYGRLSTLKVMREVTDQMREVADPYIGEANTIEQRNALSAAISKRLDALVTSGVLISYSFNLVASQQDQSLGQASLELGIVAPQELRKITTVMGLKR